ncbi:MAG: LrgB family protein, partial [Elioraea sp.]|nr:LrgB family protein [Elioraea sp.]
MPATLAPKATTTSIALASAETLRGLSSLAAVVVVLSGAAGGVALGPPVLTRLGVDDRRARFRGRARRTRHRHGAISVSETACAFAASAVGANALATALMPPL